MRYSILIHFLFLSLLLCQQLDVTFRYVKDPNENFTSVFVPGTMPNGTSNDWGPNSNGLISPGALSQMTFTHELAALILIEQIYRGTEIIRNTPYHVE